MAKCSSKDEPPKFRYDDGAGLSVYKTKRTESSSGATQNIHKQRNENVSVRLGEITKEDLSEREWKKLSIYITHTIE